MTAHRVVFAPASRRVDKELGVALHYPGSDRAFGILANVCDADLLAEAVQWAIDGKVRGAFNITNGDVFRWRQMWPAIAEHFGIEPGNAQPFSMQERMAAQEGMWSEMVRRHGLAKHGVLDLGQGSFGDFIFRVEDDAIFDVGKARRAGFNAMTRDSKQSLLKHFDAMRERKLIP